MLKSLDEAGRVTWATKVRNLLCRYGFGYAWYSQEVGKAKEFLSMFKSRLKDNLIQEWFSDINNSNKAYHYRYFYNIFQVQFYVEINLPAPLSRILARLRCSVHELKVETGRDNCTPHAERICTLCSNNQVEDEFHLVLQCPVYAVLKHSFIPKRYVKRHPCPSDFYALMQSHNESVISRLAQYLIEAIQRRNET